MNLDEIEKSLMQKVSQIATSDDPAHDLLHFKRVVKMAKKLGLQENAKMEVVIPAAWLHDFVIIPKNDPRRKKASQMSADAAIEFLDSIQYPSRFFDEISHAIAAHSFSANIEAKTLEAQIVQDADRLDGIGAIGLARCFAVAGMLKTSLYAEEDPFCKSREINDRSYTIDHFYAKLFKVAEFLKTKSGQEEGKRRLQIMQTYLEDLKGEIT